MRWFSHVRFWFWDNRRYTAAQIQELHALKRLSATHLASFFDESFFNMFVARMEGERYYVDLTDFDNRILWLNIPTVGRLAPIHSCYFLYFAYAISDAFKRYDEHRQNRWYGSGHSNDPTRLFILQLHQIANWLVSAPPDAATLNRVNALLVYLTAVQNEKVFTQEPDNQGSMDTLLENLRSTLKQIQERTQYKIRTPLPLPVQQSVSGEQKLQDARFGPMPSGQGQPINGLYGSLLAFNPLELYRSQRHAYALCLETHRTLPEPSFFSRGLHHRSVYLKNPERLFKIAEDFLWFKGEDCVTDYNRLRSPEGKVLLADLRSRLAAEIAEAERLSDDLWWPFHRSSLNFFSCWKQSFEWGLKVLQNIERNSQGFDSEADRLTAYDYEQLLNVLVPSPPRSSNSVAAIVPVVSVRDLLAESKARHEQLLAEMRAEHERYLAQIRSERDEVISTNQEWLSRIAAERESKWDIVVDEEEKETVIPAALLK